MEPSRVHFEPFFIWSNRPKIMYAPGVRSELPYEMARLGGRRVAVFTDRGVVRAGVAEMVIAEIRNSDLQLAGVFDDILQDARIEVINRGAAFYRDCGADSMVVVGGGSVQDTAKAVNILIGEGLDDFQPLADQAALYDQAKPLPPQIVFPTTAGTGSEVTTGMVVLDVEAKAKMQVGHPFNADIAMLDPELTLKLPPKITAFTGMDALTHAIEGVTSTAAEPISDALGLHAIRMIFHDLPACVREPGDVDARGRMLIASAMAGLCFGNAMTGAVHALAHALGGQYGIPHGLANAIMLPEVMAFNLEEVPLRYMMIAEAMGVDIRGLTPGEAARAAVEAVRRLKTEIGLTETLRDFGVPADRDQLRALVELASGDGQLPYNPRVPEDEDIIDLYLKAI
ncbi:MAG: iron-containing alcohol dehydrogenase [Pseudomonadota bacterium]